MLSARTKPWRLYFTAVNVRVCPLSTIGLLQHTTERRTIWQCRQEEKTDHHGQKKNCSRLLTTTFALCIAKHLCTTALLVGRWRLYEFMFCNHPHEIISCQLV